MKQFCLDTPGVCGGRYSPVVLSVETLAMLASSDKVLKKVIELTEQLASDEYCDYVQQFYRKGLALAGNAWTFMDMVTTLYAVAEIGKPEKYLEIGVRRGRSSCAVGAASPATEIFAFDMWQDNYAGNENPGPQFVKNELKKTGHTGRIQFFNGDSHETVPKFFKENHEIVFDLITVDGDHSVNGAWDDLVNVVPHLAVGGVLVFDDTANPFCPGLDKVWQRLLDADKGLRGYSYSELGTGVSFALRMKEAEFLPKGRNMFWRK